MEDASDDYIEALIFLQLCDADAACKTITNVRRHLSFLQYKKDKLQMLKDNIQRRVLVMGWTQFKTQYSKDKIQKMDEELTERLVEIFKS